MDINDLRRARSAAATRMQTAADQIATLEAAETPDTDALATASAEFDAAEAAFNTAAAAVQRAETVEAAVAASIDTGDEANPGTPARAATARSEADQGVTAGLMVQALARAGGDRDRACRYLDEDGHSSVSAALTGATDSGGGVTIPRPVSSEIIELLRPRVAVRASGARTIDMPAGELRHAQQTGSARASYTAENAAIPESEPTFGKIDQTFKKLTSLVPIGNSLLRHATPQLGRMVRDDMLRVMALREDLAFLRGDGTQNTPVGLRNWMLAGHWQTGVAKTVAAAEAAVRRAVNAVEDSDVAMVTPGWIMRASAKNWLASLRDPNSGALIFPSIDQSGTLRGYPIRTTSQLPDNLGDGGDETEIYFGDFDEVMIGDSMAITISNSTDAAYIDANGDMVSAFQNDLTLMRAISEHDLAPRHDVALSGIQAVGWSL